MILLPENLVIEPSATHYIVPVTWETVEQVKHATQKAMFDCWLVQYNTLLFGSAVNRYETLALLLNPYVIPHKVKLPQVNVRRCVYEAILPFTNETIDDPLTEAEQEVANWLPNGYCKQTPNRKLYRPLSGAELIGSHVDNGLCILHPWLTRAMTCNELNACLTHCGLNYFDEHITNNHDIVDTPIDPSYLQYNISHKLPACHYNVIVPRTFEYIKGVTRIDDF